MKKIFFSLAALFSYLLFVDAHTTTFPTFNYDWKPGKYYGSKAGNTPFNPCSGKCTRVCAEIKLISPTDGPITTDKKKSLSTTFSNQTAKDASPIMLWRVPKDFPEEEFQKIKTKESLYSNLRVVRGLEKEEAK